MPSLQSIAPAASFHLAGLSVEFTMLAFAIVLGVIQLFLAAQFVTRDRGTLWNIGPRDGTPAPLGKTAGRLDRAFRNFMETFPFFAAAVVMAAVLDRHNWQTLLGSELYLGARVLYVPLYAQGVTGLRTLAFLASVVGIGLVLAAVFSASP